MARLALKPLLGTIAGATALTLTSTGTAKAAVLNYAFEVKIDQGPFAGLHKGAFWFDDTKLVPCISAPEYNCATPGDSGLSVVFNFMGNTYTEKNDVDYAGGRRIRNSQNQIVTVPPLKFASVYYYPTQAGAGRIPFVLSLMVMFPETQKNFAILGNIFRAGFPTYEAADNQAYQAGFVRYFRLPNNSPEEPSPCQVSPGSCNPTAVPEPSEIAGSVVGLGILGLIARSRRKRSTFKP